MKTTYVPIAGQPVLVLCRAEASQDFLKCRSNLSDASRAAIDDIVLMIQRQPESPGYISFPQTNIGICHVRHRADVYVLYQVFTQYPTSHKLIKLWYCGHSRFERGMTRFDFEDTDDL